MFPRVLLLTLCVATGHIESFADATLVTDPALEVATLITFGIT